MAEISMEALCQLAERGYGKQVEKFAKNIMRHFELDCAHEAIEFPTDEDVNRLNREKRNIVNDVSDLHYISVAENTKPVLPGIERMSNGEIARCVVAFAETQYRIDKERSFEKE
jgi:hypothetical protein